MIGTLARSRSTLSNAAPSAGRTKKANGVYVAFNAHATSWNTGKIAPITKKARTTRVQSRWKEIPAADCRPRWWVFRFRVIFTSGWPGEATAILVLNPAELLRVYLGRGVECPTRE